MSAELKERYIEIVDEAIRKFGKEVASYMDVAFGIGVEHGRYEDDE